MFVSKEVPQVIKNFRGCGLDIEEVLLLPLHRSTPEELKPHDGTLHYPIILGTDLRNRMLDHELIKQGFKVKRIDRLLVIILLRVIVLVKDTLQPLLRNHIRLDHIKLLLDISSDS